MQCHRQLITAFGAAIASRMVSFAAGIPPSCFRITLCADLTTNWPRIVASCWVMVARLTQSWGEAGLLVVSDIARSSHKIMGDYQRCPFLPVKLVCPKTFMRGVTNPPKSVSFRARYHSRR
jgi:hypothetical protein